MCGAAPATTISIRRHVGLLILQRFVKVRQPLCRDCGLAAVRAFTLRTLWQGWWGYISFFVNWFVLVTNLIAWRRFSKLPTPTRAEVGSRTWDSAWDVDREPARVGTAVE
jgi:hypothetical protein